MKKILVVDDSNLICEKIEMILLKEGYDVQCAMNGTEGLELHHSKPFDIIITDLVMPDMEGIEFIIKIKKHSPKTKVIAISGANPLYLRTAIEIGADYKIQKPFTDNELIDAVNIINSVVNNK